jgi:hypothetical protein
MLRRFTVGACAAVLLAFPRPVNGQSCSVDTVHAETVAAAMYIAARAHGDYDILATTNATRFQTALLLELVRQARQSNMAGEVLFVRAEDIYFGFLKVAGLQGEPENAPLYRRLAYEYRQDIEIEYRSDGVIQEVVSGPPHYTALNVRVAWPDRQDAVTKYGFTDTLAVPKLKITNHQVITYRLVDFGNMVAYDKVDGLSGRPLTGLLATLFKLIGEGNVRWSRSMYSVDGLQIIRARAKKIFNKTATVTIDPDGRAHKDVPDDRPDLAAIAERLEQKIEITYYPYRCW